MSDEVLVLNRPAPRTLDELADIARGPLERAGAIRAVAFGSYARRTADAWSDLDLAVILDTDLPRLERGRLLAEVIDALPVGVDLLVYTPAEWQAGVDRGLGVFAALESEGATLYERP